MPKKKEALAPAPASRKTKEEKEVKPPSRDERALALMDDINKKTRGRAVLMPASEYVLPYLTKRLPTGLLTLDLELRGGVPAGGISQVIGRKNAGKSWLAWQMIRQLQHMLGEDMMVLLAMTEIPADRSQARLAGVKISMGEEFIEESNKARAQSGQPLFTKEECESLVAETGTIHELHALAAEDFYDVVLRSIEQNIYHLIIIDSIGNIMSAAAEENKSVHDKTYAGAAGPNTVFLQKMTNLLTMKDEWGKVRDTCVLGINQVRDNIKDPNKPYKAPGGNLLEHAKLLDLYLESGSMLGENQPVLKMTNDGLTKVQNFVAYGKQVNWKIEKGKAGMHEGGKGTYTYDFRIGTVDFYTDTIIAGLNYGVIEGSGSYVIHNPANPKEPLLQIRGRDNLIKALETDAREKAAVGDPNTLMNFIREACFRKAGININYEWDT